MTIIPNLIRSGKWIVFAAIIAFQFTRADAQVSRSRNKEDFDVNRFQVKKISIGVPADQIHVVNVSHIEVIDARADTGRIGLMQKRVVSVISLAANELNHDEQLIAKPSFVKLNGGLQGEATLFANRYLQLPESDTTRTVLMLIKKLWLSDELNIDETISGNKKMLTTERREAWTSGIDIKTEFYAKSGQNYYALCRFDSVINKNLTVSEYGADYVAIGLGAALRKLSTMNEKIEKGFAGHRAFNLKEIEQHSKEALAIPALTEAILNRGVYMSFEEFKNNAPSAPNYTIKKEKRADMLYVQQANGQESPSRNVWGYCDGKNAYIKAGDNYFLLQRLENAFYIFGVKNLRWMDAQYAPSPVGMIEYRKAGYVTDLRPFQLDWSTGELY